MENSRGLYFNQLGDDFNKFIDDYDVRQRCFLIFEDLLKDVSFENKKVLEVGCGTGRISTEIISRKANLTVLDIGDNLVRQVVGKFKCEGVVGDACCLPFEDSTFDIVVSSECIEHTPNPVKAIQEMVRVCRLGGIVCITSPNKFWYPVLWASVKFRLRKFRGVENWLFPKRAFNTLRDSKMEDLCLSGCHLWPFQLKFSRPVLKHIDKYTGNYLYPIMINYGIRGRKLHG